MSKPAPHSELPENTYLARRTDELVARIKRRPATSSVENQTLSHYAERRHEKRVEAFLRGEPIDSKPGKPALSKELRLTGSSGTCRYCGEPIRWAKNARDKYVPVDSDDGLHMRSCRRYSLKLPSSAATARPDPLPPRVATTGGGQSGAAAAVNTALRPLTAAEEAKRAIRLR